MTQRALYHDHVSSARLFTDAENHLNKWNNMRSLQSQLESQFTICQMLREEIHKTKKKIQQMKELYKKNEQQILKEGQLYLLFHTRRE